MVSNETNVAFVFKKRYSDDQVMDGARRGRPVMSMMKKRDVMEGEKANYTYAVRIGNPQGVSATFADGQSAISGSTGEQFSAVRRDQYGFIRLHGPSLRAARKRGKGAFYDFVTMETDGIIEERGDQHAHAMFGDGNGWLGRRSSASSDTITLTVADHVRNFKLGMTVVADNDIAGGSLRSGDTTVDAIDEDAGTIELASAGAIGSFADNDYLFRIGDPGNQINGFQEFIPLTAPSFGVDSFRGVDRGRHARLLAGVRTNDPGGSLLENCGLTAVKIKQTSAVAGMKKKIAVLNPINFWAICRELNAKVTYDGGGDKATYGFEGFDIATPAGTVRAVSDAHCPTTLNWLLAMDTWYWATLDAWIHVIRDDKNQPFMRVAGADQMELQIRSMGNPVCMMPGANGIWDT
jgi:hypothetical protein